MNAAQKAGYERVRRANMEHQAAKRAAKPIIYKSRIPTAHRGCLGLTVDEQGRPMIARDGKGGVPPSVFEMMLLEKVAELEKEIACLRALRAKQSS